MNDGMRTILQVTNCTDVLRQMFFAKGKRVCFKMFLKMSILEKLILGANFTSEVRNLTILLKKEALNADVLRKGIFKLKELLCLVWL